MISLAKSRLGEEGSRGSSGLSLRNSQDWLCLCLALGFVWPGRT